MSFSYTNKNGTRRAVIETDKGQTKIYTGHRPPASLDSEYGSGKPCVEIDRWDYSTGRMQGKSLDGSMFFFYLQQEIRRLA